MNVKQIDAKDTYFIRKQVLRPDFPGNTCEFEGDHSDQTFHLGGYKNDELASIASFYFVNNPDIDEPYQFQLRGMATLDKYRGQGLSSALLRTAFPLILRNNVHLLWCNARIEAVGFYKKVGFEIISDEFEIPGVGKHYLMTKKI